MRSVKLRHYPSPPLLDLEARGLPSGRLSDRSQPRLAGGLQHAVSPVEHEDPTGMKFAGGRRPLAHRLDLRGAEVT